jgi:hypothetical protein
VTRSVIRACAIGAGLISLVLGARARAQELTPAEQAELDAATGADAAASVPAASPAPLSLQSMAPDIAIITDVALAWFSEDENLQVGGHDPNTNGFSLQQLELSLGKNVDPYFRYDANIVFSQFGVEIEEAYATTLALPYQLQLRAGQFLTRFGRINATHPHAWDFVDQAFAISRIFGAEGNRGLGLELSWLSPLPWYVEVVGSLTDARDDLSDDWSLFWGLSAATGPNATGHHNHSDVFATDVYLKYRPITRQSDTVVVLQSEWFYRRRQVPRDVVADVNGYAYLFWRFAQRWGTAARYEYGGAADGPDDLDPEWTSARQRVSADLTFWPTEFSRLRGQLSADLPGWQDDPIYAFMLTGEFVVGAHGAHKF